MLNKACFKSFSSIDKNLRKIHEYYLKLNTGRHFINPTHDYPKLVNKLSFSFYKEMLDEYEKNVKPQLDDVEANALVLNTLKSKGISVEYHESEGYLKLYRYDDLFLYELKLFNFEDKIEDEAENKKFPKELIDLKLEKNVDKDDRFYFKHAGNYINPASVAHFKNAYEEHVKQVDKNIDNPFLKKPIDTNLMEMEIRVKNQINSSVFLVKGFICD